jgi:AcrR family transcriptional regulator
MSGTPKNRRGRPQVEGLAERRSEEILAAATEVFAEKGLRAADVQEIADRIGVGKGTVYRYFPSKDELFLATVRRVMERLSESLRVVFVAPLDPVARLRNLIGTFLDFFDRQPAFVEVLILERAEFRDPGRLTFFAYRDALREEFRSFDDELIAAGVLRNPPAPQQNDALSRLLYGAIFTARYAGDHNPDEQIRAELTDFLLHGLLT